MEVHARQPDGHRANFLHQSEMMLLTESGEGELGRVLDHARQHIIRPSKVMLDVAYINNKQEQLASTPVSDEALSLHFSELERLSAVNPWFKVELRIARAIVNLTGKFEADMMSSKPLYIPKMNDQGLPVFTYDRSKEELGAIVDAWIKGPNWGKVDDKEGPILQPKVKGDDGVARKERYEVEELEYEQSKGIVRVAVHADFCNWGLISRLKEGHTAEETRLLNAQIVSNILNQASAVGHAYGIRFVFNHVSFVHTQASMRSVYNGEDWRGQAVCREREVEVLNLICSNTSAKSLQNLNSCIRLKYLYLDGCPLSSSSGKTKANVFDELTQHGAVPELRCLSIVGTSALLSSDWLSKVESKCPKLTLVFFTRRPGDKALGWSDVVMMQAMREPSLLPCGHVGDATSLQQIKNHLCPICRTPFTLKKLIALRASVTQLTRVADSWKATIVDTLRHPLDDKVLYHECGELYNLSSVNLLYGTSAQEINDDLIEKLKALPCLRCGSLFHDLQVCFPRSAVEDDVQFTSLQEACGYFSSDL